MKLSCSSSSLTEDKKNFNDAINSTFSKSCSLTLTVKELKETLIKCLETRYKDVNVIIKTKHDIEYDEDAFSINLEIFTDLIDDSGKVTLDSKKTIRVLLDCFNVYNKIDLSFIDSEYHKDFNDDNVKISIQFTAYI